eukprot:768627-Hanusia_phi.AAC.2
MMILNPNSANAQARRTRRSHSTTELCHESGRAGPAAGESLCDSDLCQSKSNPQPRPADSERRTSELSNKIDPEVNVIPSAMIIQDWKVARRVRVHLRSQGASKPGQKVYRAYQINRPPSDRPGTRDSAAEARDSVSQRYGSRGPRVPPPGPREARAGSENGARRIFKAWRSLSTLFRLPCCQKPPDLTGRLLQMLLEEGQRGEHTSAQDEKVLQRIFERIDFKRDNKIDKEELEHCLRTLGYEPVKVNQYGISEVEQMIWEVRSQSRDEKCVIHAGRWTRTVTVVLAWRSFTLCLFATATTGECVGGFCQFMTLDRDGDGSISTEECMEMIIHRFGRQKLEEVFHNGMHDREITLSDFLLQVNRSYSMPDKGRKKSGRTRSSIQGDGSVRVGVSVCVFTSSLLTAIPPSTLQLMFAAGRMPLIGKR